MKKKVLITIKEQYSDKLDEVVNRLGALHMEIEHRLPFGVITGSLDDAQIPSVSAEEFIESIENDDEVGI